MLLRETRKRIAFSSIALAAVVLGSTLLALSVSRAAETTSEPGNIAQAGPLIRAGIEAYNQGDYPTAVSDLKQAQALVPDHSPTALYLGLAYLKQGNLSEAIAAWQKYITLTPDTPTEKTNNLQETVARDLGILLRAQDHQLAQEELGHEREIGPPDPNAIAITYYRNLGSPDLTPLQKGLTALVIADVAKVPQLKVVERGRMEALLDEMKLGSSGLVDPNSAARAGRLLGASQVVTGSYLDPSKGQVRIDSVLAQSSSAQLRGTEDVTGPMEHFYDVEKQLSAAILKDLGYSEDQLKARGVWQQVQTPQTTNYQAFVAFSRGLDAQDRQDYPQARTLFKQALASDPSFALALQELNRTPMAAMSGGAVADSVGSQAPSVAAVMAALPGQAVASYPSLRIITAISRAPGALVPPPPPIIPPAMPALPSFPPHP